MLCMSCVTNRDSLFFFFNDTATTEIYTLSLHDALPISAADRRSSLPRRPTSGVRPGCRTAAWPTRPRCAGGSRTWPRSPRSEEHTSELQSQSNLVCRLLLEKKKKLRRAADRTRTAHTTI